MRPIGNNPGLVAAPPLAGERAEPATPQSRATHAARIEDILSALPKSSVNGSASANAVQAEFTHQLNTSIVACTSWEDAQAAAASALRQFANIDVVGWYASGGERIGQTDQFTSLTAAGSQITDDQREYFQGVVSGLSTDATIGTVYSPDQARIYIAASVRGLNGHCLLGSFAADSVNGGRSQITAVEFAAGRLSEWFAVSQQELAVRNSLHVAALVELLGKLAAAQSVDAAAKSLTNELQRYLGATEVSLGLCQDQRLKCQLAATSSVPDVDPFSDGTRLNEAVLQESIARSAVSIWPAVDSANRHALLSHEQCADSHRAVAVVSTPLRSEDGVVVGALVATFHDLPSAQKALKFLFAAERGIATAIAATTQGTQSYLDKMTAVFRRAVGSGKFKVFVCGVMIAAAVMCIPVDYRVTCDSELQPVFRRFVAAPFDAPLDECLVEPGDVVEADQLLARLDGRELQWELAGVRADLGKAQKEHNAHLSKQDFGEAAIARHEIDRLQNQASLLEQRTQSLEIRSPIAGVIVAGDLKDTEGVPLETGQSLFEVAPLDRMVVEVSIPEEDVWHVRPDMTLNLRLDALPGQSVEATILRIHPRAELRDHENVFVAEAEMDNTEKRLRPGMRGDAKISTGHRLLGWNLFHKPVAYVTGWLGW